MKERTKILIASIGMSLFISVLSLICAQSYFNSKEIRLASDRCYEVGGLPKVSSDYLHLNYSFSCQEDK
ncbi:hypothetical protein SAMN05216389_11826 [Oceanobacillus limi]|uniref:Uncharacterized protein n=1 Tax=Oceanobacillus limi TaxID=930131 RepID=A0A1I0G045_9BACI|nr:hypothetical protein [Oceanobacillus limi]SET63946.1 hypothetical protein SAMN05216389_11826 [Oceanobacillus limi]